MSFTLAQKKQMSFKIESIEGTKETLAAADAKTIVYDPVFKSDPDKIASDPARTGGSAQPQLIGKQPATLGFKVRVRGSGTTTTDPDWIKFLRCCGMGTSLLKSITIGAIATGPFVHGETITGSISGATGRVVFKTVNGAAKIYYVAVGTNEFSSGEVLTGSTSGATATTSGVPVSEGREYKPVIDSVPSGSAGLNQDGFFEQMKGSRGSAKFSVVAGQPGVVEFNFSGVDAGHTAESFFENVNYEDEAVPVFMGEAILIDSYVPKVSSIEFDLGSKLAERDDPTDAKSILSYAYISRMITGSIVIQMVAPATYDFMTKYKAGTEFVLDFTLGAFRFYFTRNQITNIEKTEKDGLAQFSISFQANGSMDKEDDFCMIHTS